jgi:hypothetical protein
MLRKQIVARRVQLKHMTQLLRMINKGNIPKSEACIIHNNQQIQMVMFRKRPFELRGRW